MKRFLLILIACFALATVAQAKGEPDFASKFLTLYGKTADID